MKPELNLTLRQQRILDALEATKTGILSFELRQIAGAMNVAHEVQELRRKGYKISCNMEPYTTQDGVRSRIGRYLLHIHQEKQTEISRPALRKQTLYP